MKYQIFTGEKLNVLFIQTYTKAEVFSITHAPLGLLYLASIARQNNNTITLLRCDVTSKSSIEETTEKVKEADICAITTYTSQILLQYNLLNKIKHKSPTCIIVAGGPHASSLPKKTMEECNAIDFIVCGEGEQAFNELLYNLQSGINKLEKIKSLVYRKNDGEIAINPISPPSDIDDIPLPAHELFKPYYTYASVITSRGCYLNCEFCYKEIFGQKVRRRSPQNVIKELKLLVSELNIISIMFLDDLFQSDDMWLNEFFSLLKNENLNFNWGCTIDISTFSEEKCKIFTENGCIEVYIGVESADEDIIKKAGKIHTPKQAKDVIKTTKEYGLLSRSFYIIGHRHDNENTIRQTINFALLNRTTFSTFYTMMPFPGSKAYEHVESQDKYNWRLFQLTDRRNLLLPSICQLHSRILKKYQEETIAKFYGNIDFIMESLSYKTLSIKYILTMFFYGLMARLFRIRFKKIYDF